ncbi:hypothetical protein LTR10_002305 [Elasticomyces elasticus]|nr:hypothetical protein LTR10_002305 [Elasticomyces elasticus]KAK4973624.1 hypothetical protein LTR42_005613 [Elasticomyces elasticus]
MRVSKRKASEHADRLEKGVTRHMHEKTAVRPNRGQGEISIQAGDRSDTKSFFRACQAEARVAAYLGYTDIAHLRRYFISHHFLKHYVRYAGAVDWSAGMIRVFPSLDLIRDDFIDRAAEDEYPVVDFKAQKYFPDRAGAHQQQYLAHLLVLMVNELDTSQGEDRAVNRREQRAMEEQLRQLPPRAFDAQTKLPELGNRAVKAPHFITMFKESDLEAYNRAWIMMKYFSYCVNSVAPWRRFDLETWAESKLVALEHVPDWMRRGSVEEDSCDKDDEEMIPVLGHKEFARPDVTDARQEQHATGHQRTSAGMKALSRQESEETASLPPARKPSVIDLTTDCDNDLPAVKQEAQISTHSTKLARSADRSAVEEDDDIEDLEDQLKEVQIKRKLRALKKRKVDSSHAFA